MKQISRWLRPVLVGVILSAMSSRTAIADDATSAAAAAEAQARAETAAAEAEKAKYEAQLAAEKAKFGALAEYTNAGTVDVSANSGKLESSLLSAEATHALGKVIAGRLVEHCQSHNALMLIRESDQITFDAYDAFNAQLDSISKQLNNAKQDVKSALDTLITGEISVKTSFPAVGTALNILGNLFRSEYKLSYIELTPDDVSLMKAIAGSALEAKVGCSLSMPSVFSPPSDFNKNLALKDLNHLDSLRQTSAKALADAKKTFAALQELSKSAKSEAAKASEANASTLAGPIADLTAAIQRYDDFSAKIGTPDDKGVVPLAAIVRQARVFEIISGGGLLLAVKMNFTGGSAYAKKNFWTFFGSMPFYVSGGNVASFTLIDGKTGTVLDAGILAQSEPFTKINKATDRYVRGYPKNTSPQ